MEKSLNIIGGGLAGSEAAWQAAQCGVNVNLFEMRPFVQTGAHATADLAELICSNSLGSRLPDRANGVLSAELQRLNSLLLDCATQTQIPAGGALAVGREAFSRLVTEKIVNHPNITLIREEVKTIPQGVTVIASGPLTSPALSAEIQKLAGMDSLFFFDALAPIVTGESIDMNIAFRASRYDRGVQEEGDYINAPFTREQYDHFVSELIKAERIELKSFETQLDMGVRAGLDPFFESCLPVEVIAQRGERALAFGPMRPVGLTNPHTNHRPYAVVQLRQDNLAGDLYNLVGFQTNLKFPEQKRVFRLIPGLENAEFVRYGQMHRNTFIATPLLLNAHLQFKTKPRLFFAGQITGVEGYLGNIATGLLAGLNAVRFLHDQPLLQPPPTTMLGALLNYITQAEINHFQPMKANFGILPPLSNPPRNKRERASAYADRALQDMQNWLTDHPLDGQP
ncbi:MAG: methylenetetrahydrofolate--tRNA-(uracil(54)-C(5))-methyltransferase (FADH(2)-oxidizing) TrmFO [Chloroflexi bacterium]|nr:methylenetetrahydrofolate--tRNA-(uracil(54)-C(5))-methyltransferase (FADH(2)-oxidizing) TrmFO [Chloroflexota bacterium]